MTSPYVIDADHRDALQNKILEHLNVCSVTKPLKRKLDDLCQDAIDATTDYLKDGYESVIEDIVRDRAKRLVVALLKGDHDTAKFFCLEKTIHHWGINAGKDFTYDPDGIRKAIVETFKAEIVSAEISALKEENERQAEELKWRREERHY